MLDPTAYAYEACEPSVLVGSRPPAYPGASIDVPSPSQAR